MKLHFWAVGKMDETYIKEGVSLFTKRISHYYPVDWRLFPPAKQKSSFSQDDLKKSEAEALLNNLDHHDVLIALDKRGKQWSSEDVADFIQQCANESSRDVIFLIGGAYGLHETILKRANFTWSLSKLVFPHQLVRLILAEQIYRACTILRNEKYHHS